MNNPEKYPHAAPADEKPPHSAYVTQVERRAFYFGADDARLFGWLHLPRDKPAGAVGMVLCPPLGIDYVNTYPVLRHLANRLAFHGIPVLRFDYSGTGNSAGFDSDPGRVTQWLRDINAARTALMQAAGCADAGLCGIRIGATLAARVAHESALPCLVAWGPVARGRAYVREMRAMHLTAEGPIGENATHSGEIEAGGLVFTEETARDLAGLELEKLQPRAAQILFAARDDFPGDQVLPQAWLREGVQAELKALTGFAGMLVSPHNSQYVMPYPALDQLERWIVDAVHAVKPVDFRAAKVCIPETALQNSMTVRGRPAAAQPEVRETVLRFGENNTRFAIVAEPLSGAWPEAPWAILSNSGALHTAGPNRLYTLLSRALAHAGMRCVRFDFPGVGDSAALSAAAENRAYQTSNSAEIGQLIAALQREHNAQQFILMGLCSGAYASFHGGLELKTLPIAECLLFNPLTFYWKEGMSLDDPLPIDADAQERMEHLNLWQYYLGRMRDARSWKNLLTARSNTWQLVGAMLQRARIAAREHAQALLGAVKPSDARTVDPLTRDVQAIVESGRRLSFVFARSDPGYGLLMTHAAAVVRRYLRKQRIHIAFVERANHTFTSQAARRDFINRVIEHLRARYAASGRRSAP